MNILHLFILAAPLLGTAMVVSMRPCQCRKRCKYETECDSCPIKSLENDLQTPARDRRLIARSRH